MSAVTASPPPPVYNIRDMVDRKPLGKTGAAGTDAATGEGVSKNPGAAFNRLVEKHGKPAVEAAVALGVHDRSVAKMTEVIDASNLPPAMKEAATSAFAEMEGAPSGNPSSDVSQDVEDQLGPYMDTQVESFLEPVAKKGVTKADVAALAVSAAVSNPIARAGNPATTKSPDTTSQAVTQEAPAQVYGNLVKQFGQPAVDAAVDRAFGDRGITKVQEAIGDSELTPVEKKAAIAMLEGRRASPVDTAKSSDAGSAQQAEQDAADQAVNDQLGPTIDKQITSDPGFKKIVADVIKMIREDTEDAMNPNQKKSKRGKSGGAPQAGGMNGAQQVGGAGAHGGHGAQPAGATNAAPQAGGAGAAPQAGGADAASQAGGASAASQTGGASAAPQAGGASAAPQAGGANAAPQAGGAGAAPQAGGANAAPQAGGADATPKAVGADAAEEADGAQQSDGGNKAFPTDGSQINSSNVDDFETSSNWLVLLASVLGKLSGKFLQKMVDKGKEIGGLSEEGNEKLFASISAEMQGAAQMFKICQETIAAVVKTAGEGLVSVARK